MNRRNDAWLAFAVALAARLGIVMWAGDRFPPAGDGTYYDIFARSLASGQGYTWLWPDGARTYAAHYPVGYPAIVATAYVFFGQSAKIAMIVNALLGATAAFAGHRLLANATTRWLSLCGALAIALHPALVPYTAAIMTEGVTAALLCIAATFAERARGSRPWAWRVAAAVTMGAATLVRPQCLLLTPLLGWLAAGPSTRVRSRVTASVGVVALSLLCCLPWTARNCVRMGQCSLVSMNGGWNLLIGAQTHNGAWAPIDVPEACRTVWDEGAKNACFERVAHQEIRANPSAWIASIPAKLGATFDYFGAAPWYLHQSNPRAFPESAKNVLGAVETVISRLLVIGALIACARLRGVRSHARTFACIVGVGFALTVHAWPAYLALAVAVALLGSRALHRMPLVVPWTAGVIAATSGTHAVFFGAGRYGLVVVPFVTLLAFIGRESPSLPEQNGP